MKKKILFSTVLILAVCAFTGYKFLYKSHRDISSEEASFTLSVAMLQSKFTENDSLANAKYADKTIVIGGKITSIDPAANSISIDNKLSAVLKDSLTADLRLGKEVKIKGRFVGYDDLLEELKMDQVSISN